MCPPSRQLSVVIPVYNNWWLTARCLRELERLREACSLRFETIVVDNASTDETPVAISGFPWVRYLRNEKNDNFAGACNSGVRMAEAPVTLLLNNDAYPLGDAFTPFVRAFDRDEVAIAGGALFFEDGVTQAAGLAVLPNAHWHYFFRNLPPELDAVNLSRDALGVSGAAMAVRTKWFLENGGFDESFINGFEDVDLCLRAREQGRVIEYVADARFAHYEAASAGRFAHEAQNERRFYERWASSMARLPRTARGSVGAIAVRSAPGENALLAAAREDLIAALRAFGHPVVPNAIAPWQRLDRRFRQAATIEWFTGETPSCGIALERRADGAASMRTNGAITLDVVWLPCAAPERTQRLRLRRSHSPACATVGVCGDETAESVAAELLKVGYSSLCITPEMLFGDDGAEFACVVHAGLTDESAFGNVLLAQSGLPTIALETPQLRALFSVDVASICTPAGLVDSVARMVRDPEARVRQGNLAASDARRRFSPRRSAIRVVDVLCAARFGLERPAAARTNTPL